MQDTAYSAAVVTFRRPGSLRDVLDSLLQQTQPPSLVIVADNDVEESARPVVESLVSATGTRILHVPMGSNLGPAGGWARAAAVAGNEPDRGEWLAVIDDDDPITDVEVFRRLLQSAVQAPGDVAAIGLRGARLRRSRATLTRVQPDQGGVVAVDYLASGGAPLYRWSAVDAVGFFDERLFFGFEDLDLGLRLRAHGMTVVVADVGSSHVVADTSSDRSPWREYFKTRALVVICRRHLSVVALIATLTRTLLIGAVPLLLRERRVDLVAARWRGAYHGCRSRLGPQGRDPSRNPGKRDAAQTDDGISQAAANEPHT